MYFKKNIQTFLGCESNFDNADIVIFGAPYDGTTSNRPGTRFASKAMRAEMFGIETYSPYQDKDLAEYKIFDGGEIELPFGSAKRTLDIIENYTFKLLGNKKFPVMIGGEHTVTLGAVRAVKKKYPNLHIIHFDAHADLRDNYLGEKLSHACVIRRCHDIVGDNRIFQFGIRSGEKEEFVFAKEHTFMQKFSICGIRDTVEKLKGVPIYLTVDLDVLDTSVLPATGTPEAGGVTFNELMAALRDVSTLDIVGADLCELSPPYDNNGASTATACKILRELLLLLSKG
jgi:agmatinase